MLSSAAIFADPAQQPTSHVGDLSYTLGYQTGKALKAQSITVDTALFTKGIADGYQNHPSAIPEKNMQTALSNMQQEVTAHMQQKQTELSEKNQQAGQLFLTANAKKPGVITTPSGLEYQILNAGSGVSPTANDTVTVNYEGSLIDGSVFDSSYQRGQPATFKVGDVIPGWQEALQLMKAGDTWMLYIPAKLAYGNTGSPGAIGPNETLVFKVNLISVQKHA